MNSRFWTWHRVGLVAVTSLALISSTFTVPPADAAYASESGFPDPPADPEVTGETYEPALRSAAVPQYPSRIVDDQKAISFTVPLTAEGVLTKESAAAGVIVRLLDDALDQPPVAPVETPEPESTPEPIPTADPTDEPGPGPIEEPSPRPEPEPSGETTPEPDATAVPEDELGSVPTQGAAGTLATRLETDDGDSAPSDGTDTPDRLILPTLPAPVPTMRPAPAQVSVDVWDAEQREESGVSYAVTITPSAPADVNAQVVLTDSAIAEVFGAGYASRLRWTLVPEASVGEPTQNGAVSVAPVRSAEGAAFTVPLAGPMVLVAAASASSTDGSGTFAASPLKPASSWDVSAQTGAFAWSYPIPAPSAPAGATPQVALSYNSQLVDGATSSTNNQPSAVGEGWQVTGSGFIERRYVPCAVEQAPGAAVAGKQDLCWATDNATISFGSRSGTIVKDAATGVWKLEGDDNSRIEKLVGTSQGCAANGTYNVECWRLTTTDGTQYWFGLNRLPGWSSGDPSTESVFSVPVFGNDAGDPCYSGSFATSSCVQGWRWNLDYVVDVHGNAEAFYYAKETNNYRLNDTTPTSYVRGGQLVRLEYGLRSDSIYAAGAATSRILFEYDANGRCNPADASSCASLPLGTAATTPATPSAYPDVPFDLNCTTGNCDDLIGPSFWSTARLATITTQSSVDGEYQTADQFALTHSFPDPGDGESAALWLESVTRTATAGHDAITEEPTSFLKTALQNRVWEDGYAPLDRYRVSAVHTPTGARISVNYSAQDCAPADVSTILANLAWNDARCFPQWWTPDVDFPTSARQDLFHKYVVTSMVEDPYTGGAGSPPTVTSYVYTGSPAWRYNDDRLIEETHRTWGEYAGYDTVEVRVGDPDTPATQETTQYVFYRGLNGDRDDSGGAKAVNVTGTSTPDERWFAGQVAKTTVLNGVAGDVVMTTTTTPWASAVTATDGTRSARVIGTASVDQTEPVSTGGTRTSSVQYTMDARGFVTTTEHSASTGEPTTCSVTDYAADNVTAWIVGLPSSSTSYAANCLDAQSSGIGLVTSHSQIAYDEQAVGAAPTGGLVTATWEAGSFTGTDLASADLIKTSDIEYDAFGRIIASTDVDGAVTTTEYEPSASAGSIAGPLTATTVTNPLSWTTLTTLDPFRGLPVEVVDENGKTTTMQYDALGRLTKGWGTDRSPGANPDAPSVAHEYAVSTTAPSSVKTTTLTTLGTTSTFTLIDGLGRTVQVQEPAPNGGAVITDTEYDRAGRGTAVNDAYWAPSVTPGTSLFIPSGINQIATRNESVYDGAGRVTDSVLRSFGAELRRTTTVYRGADRVDLDPPAGGIRSSTYTNAYGQNIRQQQWQGEVDLPTSTSTSLYYQYDASDRMIGMTDDAGNTWSWGFDLRGREITRTDPDAGTTSTSYDDKGNPVSVTDARGTTLAYVYDELNRKIEERSGTVSGTLLASWTYDTLAKGLLTSSSRFVDGDEYKTESAGYDDGYRPLGATTSIPTGAPAFGGTSYTTNTYYNPDGSVAATVLPGIGGLPSEELYPTYDQQGRPASLMGLEGYASTIKYQATGEVSQITRAGTVWSALTFTYNSGTRELHEMEETTRRNGTQFTQEALRTYTRNDVGIITEITSAGAGHATDLQCFRYDALQHLTAVWTPSSSCTGEPTGALSGPASLAAMYEVDPVTGNRVSEQRRTSSADAWDVTDYTYPADGAARPHAPTSTTETIGATTTSSTFEYDAAGGMISRAGQEIAYDASGRISEVEDGSGSEKSIYTADGQLLLRFGGSDGASLFLGDTLVRETTGTLKATWATRTYQAAGITIAQRTSGALPGVYWLTPDPVGTVGLQINVATGEVTRRWMDPFGNTRGQSVAWPSPLGFLNAPESATGLTQLGARAYDSALGMFVSVDPLLDTSEPRHANAYVYAMHSPVSYSDADGLRPIIQPPPGGGKPYTPAPRPAPSNPGGHWNPSPPAPGNTSAGDAGTPVQDDYAWWDMRGWSDETWQTIGGIGAGLLAGAAVTGALLLAGACVVATAGLCIGAIALGGAVAGLTTHTLLTAPEDRTVAGQLDASLQGAAGALIGVAVGKLLSDGLRNLPRVASGNPPSAVAVPSTSYAPKILGQLEKRGWTKDSVEDVIRNPADTIKTRDTRWNPESGTKNNDPATAYLNEDGGYVVKNDLTGDIVQVSNLNKPDWKSPWNQ